MLSKNFDSKLFLKQITVSHIFPSKDEIKKSIEHTIAQIETSRSSKTSRKFPFPKNLVKNADLTNASITNDVLNDIKTTEFSSDTGINTLLIDELIKQRSKVLSLETSLEKYVDIEKNSKQFEEENTKLKSSITLKNTQINDLQENVKQLTTQIIKYENEITALKKLANTSEMKIANDVLRNENTLLKKKHSHVNEQLQKLTQTLQSEQTSKSKITKNLEQCSKKLKTLTDTENSHIQNLQQCEDKLKSSEIDITKKNISITELTKELTDTKCSLQSIFERYLNNIYIINLERKTINMMSMIENFKHYKIFIEIVKACDGKDSSQIIEYNSYCDQFKKTNGNSPRFNSLEYAYINTISNIIIHAKEHHYSRILICDDDILLTHDFRSIIENIFKNIINLNLKYKILHLGTSQRQWKNIQYIDIKNDHFVYNCRSDSTMGSFATIYDSSVFDEILELNKKPSMPYDCGTLWSLYNKFPKECFTLYPNVVIADTRESEIRGGRDLEKVAKTFRWNLDNFTF